MTQTILTLLFLAVSVVSAVIQCASLRTLRRWADAGTEPERRVHRGMVRTSVCRVLAAVIYVGVGVAVLVARQALPVLALIVFSFVQILWQTNAVADIRLRRALDARRTDPKRSTHGTAC